MMKYASFDIFDTCLVRSCGSPSFVFEILALRVVKSHQYADIADFVKIRKEGEYKARMLSSKNEVSIYDIYDQCDFTSLTDIGLSELIDNELSIEESVLL